MIRHGDAFWRGYDLLLGVCAAIWTVALGIAVTGFGGVLF